MYKFMRFPGFKARALTFSYDDGTVFDKRLVEIFDKYGMKGTFNLNSGLFGVGRRLSLDELHELFDNSTHEIAVHGRMHLSLPSYPISAATADVLLDRLELEKCFGGIIRGMAYAYGTYSDEVIDALAKCGIVYSRITRPTRTFDIPTDWLALQPTCHHRDPELMTLADKFLETPTNRTRLTMPPRLFYVWGHSYEFNDSDNWHVIENFCEKLSGNVEIYYATNIELYEYIKAFEALVFSADGKTVKNPTATDVYTSLGAKETLIPAGKTVTLD